MAPLAPFPGWAGLSWYGSDMCAGKAPNVPLACLSARWGLLRAPRRRALAPPCASFHESGPPSAMYSKVPKRPPFLLLVLKPAPCRTRWLVSLGCPAVPLRWGSASPPRCCSGPKVPPLPRPRLFPRDLGGGVRAWLCVSFALRGSGTWAHSLVRPSEGPACSALTPQFGHLISLDGSCVQRRLGKQATLELCEQGRRGGCSAKAGLAGQVAVRPWKLTSLPWDLKAG